jgi:hypothetical protein
MASGIYLDTMEGIAYLLSRVARLSMTETKPIFGCL